MSDLRKSIKGEHAEELKNQEKAAARFKKRDEEEEDEDEFVDNFQKRRASTDDDMGGKFKERKPSRTNPDLGMTICSSFPNTALVASPRAKKPTDRVKTSSAKPRRYQRHPLLGTNIFSAPVSRLYHLQSKNTQVTLEEALTSLLNLHKNRIRVSEKQNRSRDLEQLPKLQEVLLPVCFFFGLVLRSM